LALNWIYRFIDRYHITLRRKTHTATVDEQSHGLEIVDHVNYFHELRMDFEIPYGNIANMDQTAVDLSEMFQRTMETRGSKKVTVKIPEIVPGRVTVLLSVDFDGNSWDIIRKLLETNDCI
jgi:hypothetical protein